MAEEDIGEEQKEIKEERKFMKKATKFFKQSSRGMMTKVAAGYGAVSGNAKRGGLITKNFVGLQGVFVILAFLVHLIDMRVYSFNILSAQRIFLYLLLGLLCFILVPSDNKRAHAITIIFLALGSFFLVTITNQLARALSSFTAMPTAILALGNIFLLPLFFYYGIFAGNFNTKPLLVKILSFIIIALWIVFAISSAAESGLLPSLPSVSEVASTQQQEVALNFFQTVVKGVKDSVVAVKEVPKNIALTFQRSVSLATGDYYTGTVEKNKNTPIGVYIEDVKSAAPFFTTDEQVDVFATVKARTLDEPVTITPSCSADRDLYLGTVPLGVDAFTDKPLKNFTIYTFEEQPLDCLISLDKGRHTVDFSADFNFKTLSYMKVYFMDADKKRSLDAQNIDPFIQYRISERNPVAVYTNGPVEIGMDFGNALLLVGRGHPAPTFGITISNRWDGHFTNINKLMIYVPVGFEADPTRCPGFEEVLLPFDSPDYQKGYLSYALKTSTINNILSSFKDQSFQYRTFKCGLKITDSSLILGNVPVATHFFKATSTYTYSVKKSVTVDVRPVIKEFMRPPVESITPTTSFNPPQSVVDTVYSSYWNTISSISGDLEHQLLVAAVIAQESKGNADAVSPTGVKGLMQFDSSTARQYGLCSANGCSEWDDRLNPQMSIQKGSKYLSDLENKFASFSQRDKDAYAAASYNLGASVILKAIGQTGVRIPTWEETSSIITSQFLSSFNTYRDNHCWNRAKPSTGCWNDNTRAKKVVEVKEYVKRVLSYKESFRQKEKTEKQVV